MSRARTTPRQSYRVLDVSESGRPCRTCRTRWVEEVSRMGIQEGCYELIVEDRNRAVAVYGGKTPGNTAWVKPSPGLSQVHRVQSR